MKPFVAFLGGGHRGQPQMGWWPQYSCQICSDGEAQICAEREAKSHWEQDTRVRPGQSPSPPFDSEETEACPGLRRERCCFFGGRRWDFRQPMTHLLLWPGVCGKLQPGVAFTSRPSQPSVRGLLLPSAGVAAPSRLPRESVFTTVLVHCRQFVQEPVCSLPSLARGR